MHANALRREFDSNISKQVLQLWQKCVKTPSALAVGISFRAKSSCRKLSQKKPEVEEARRGLGGWQSRRSPRRAMRRSDSNYVLRLRSQTLCPAEGQPVVAQVAQLRD